MGFREGVWTAWRPSRTSNDSICGGAHPSKGAKGGAARGIDESMNHGQLRRGRAIADSRRRHVCGGNYGPSLRNWQGGGTRPMFFGILRKGLAMGRHQRALGRGSSQSPEKSRAGDDHGIPPFKKRRVATRPALFGLLSQLLEKWRRDRRRYTIQGCEV